jgi:hypothetical protein
MLSKYCEENIKEDKEMTFKFENTTFILIRRLKRTSDD